MSNSNGIIQAPVDLINDVYRVLGIGPQNGGYSVGYACSNNHGKINMWAKYKPEIYNSIPPITLEMRKLNNFGLAPTATYTSKTSFVNAVKNGTFAGGWVYSPPAGNEWKRLSDFAGYNHKATSPFGTLNPSTGFLSSNSDFALVISAEAPEVDDGNSDSGIISIKDMQNVNADYGNWYFGILLYNSSRNLMATAAKPFSQLEDWQVDFGWVNPTNAGTYKGIPFISSKPFTLTGSEPADCKIVGIGQSGVNIILKSLSALYIPWATCWYVDNYSTVVQYEATITNTGSSNVTLTNVVLQVAFDENGLNATTLVSFGTVTVPAGTVWRKTGQVTLTSRSYQFCQMSYSGSTSEWVNFEEIEQEEPDSPDA